jgi:hypothetical protein
MLLRVFSGLGDRISTHQLVPFLANMHKALWCLAVVSLVGAVVSFIRPKHGAVAAGELAGAQPTESLAA